MSDQQHAPAVLYPGKDPVPIVHEAGWAPRPVRAGGKSRPTGIRSPDRPARSSVAIPTELLGPYDHTLDSTVISNRVFAIRSTAATANKPSILLTSRRLSLHSAFSVFIPHKSRGARTVGCMRDCAVSAAPFQFLFQHKTKVGI